MAAVGYYFMNEWSKGWMEFGLGVIVCGSIYVVLMAATGYDKTKQEVLSLLRK